MRHGPGYAKLAPSSKNALMTDAVLVGIDAGTSATKACAFTANGRLLAEESVPVALEHPAPGWAEQPAEVLTDSACAALRGLAEQIDPSGVAAIGLTGQMGGLVLVDDDGRAVSPHLSWLDGRAADAVGPGDGVGRPSPARPGRSHAVPRPEGGLVA